MTGSTGLLDNNLVRLPAGRRVRVRALARSREKTAKQFASVPVRIIKGDMLDVAGFAPALAGCDALFHTTAHFRESYKGGKHWDRLHAINPESTGRLLEAAYAAGIRRAVHISSVAVLNGPAGQSINEPMECWEADADDYYRSKILADCKVREFLDTHSSTLVALVLPGWMFGPGDVGLTSSGQVIMNFARRKLPGRIPSSFSVVDVRDVAQHQVAALKRGRGSGRYLAARRHMTIYGLVPLLAKARGVAAPTRSIPLMMLRVLATGYEMYAGVTGRPVPLSRASVELPAQEADRSHYDHAKGRCKLDCAFRPAVETLADTAARHRATGTLPARSTAFKCEMRRSTRVTPGAVLC